MIQEEVCDACKNAGKTDPSTCEDCIQLHVAYAESMGLPSPIQTYNISCTYYASDSAYINLPMFKTWDDIESWHVKWGTFHYKLKGEEDWREWPVSGDIEIGDQKNPVSVSIYDEDYSEEIDSQ